MPKIYFTKQGFTFKDKRINAFSPILEEIISVYEDLPIILRKVGTASPHLHLNN